MTVDHNGNKLGLITRVVEFDDGREYRLYLLANTAIFAVLLTAWNFFVQVALREPDNRVGLFQPY